MHPLRLVVTIVFALAAAAPAGAQVLHGRVTDAADGAHVAAALISALDAAGNPVANTISGTDGRFELPLPAAGSYRVHVSRIGYRTGISPQVAVGQGERMGVDLALRTDAVALEAVQAQVRVTPPFRDARARGFYARMDAGMGSYLTREQILTRNAARTSDLLRGIPDVRFRGGSSGTVPWVRGNAQRPQEKGYGTLLGCVPAIYIDGIQRSLRWGLRLDDLVEPSEIWGVEVYRHASEIPSELPRDSVIRNCGAIVIWTINS
jgi:hypothetical protein